MKHGHSRLLLFYRTFLNIHPQCQRTEKRFDCQNPFGESQINVRPNLTTVSLIAISF